MSEGNPLDHPGPWDADVTTVLQSAGFEDGGVSWPGPIRRLMSEAWRYGYTTGMADSAKLEEQAAAAAADRPHLITLRGPIAYPGGKDGMYVAVCSCGQYQSVVGTFAQVAGYGEAHMEAKR